EQQGECTKSSSESPEPEGDCISLKWLGGYTVQLSGTNKKTSTSHNQKAAERKPTAVSVKPTSKLPGSKRTEVRESSVRTNFQGLMRITPVMVERNNTTLYGQVKKTTARRMTTTCGLNVKTPEAKQFDASLMSNFPWTKHIEVKGFPVRTNLRSSVDTSVIGSEKEKRKNTTYSQEEKCTVRRQTYTYGLDLKSAATDLVSASLISGIKHIEVKESPVRRNFQGPMRITPIIVKWNSTNLYGQEKMPIARRETMQCTVSPISTLHGMKNIENPLRTNLHSSVETSAMTKKKEEKKRSLLHGQVKETTEKKETTTDRLNMTKSETMQSSISLISTFPGTKDIETPVRTNLQSSEGLSAMTKELEREKENDEEIKIFQYFLENEMEGLSEALKRVLISSYTHYRKSLTDPNSFSYNKMTFAESPRSISLPQSSLNMQLFNGGLPNVGNSCYVNACLQYLFTAEAFCEELSHLLDSSFHNNVNSFLRCFVNLSRLRKTSKVQGKFDKDCLLLGLIALAADINPEFTIGKQSDAHEFLCHCLTQIEEFGRGLGWKEDSEPKCPVRSNFKFMMRNIIKCSSCGYEQKNKVEEFKHISLPLEHNSVDQCLHDIVNRPTFVESKCEVCGGISASLCLKFQTLPRFLIVQLNRFKMTEYNTVIKQQMPVDIQPELHINCFPQSDAPTIGDIKAGERQTDRNELVRERQKDIMNDESGSGTTYQLISVLSHFGSTTFC
ncbi:ubiquitin carboxyl-terminal hydrolase 37-like isoform X1, partial [Clarias magur]